MYFRKTSEKDTTVYQKYRLLKCSLRHC